MYYKSVAILLLLFIVKSFANIPTITFNNGVEIPVLGLGTLKSQPAEVTKAVKDAIDIGYRHFDTAYIYKNEENVGEALAEKITKGVVRRSDLFISTKLWNTFHAPEKVECSLRNTLKDLRLDYIDLLMMHWPMGFKKNDSGFTEEDYVDTWFAMEKVYQKGLARSIGISNFNETQIERLLRHATVVPVTNQVECHPYFNQKRLIDFCASKNITVIAYSPFGRGKKPANKPNIPLLLENPQIQCIAQKYNKTAAQITLRYQVERGIIVVAKSVHKNRIAANFGIFDFKLLPEDVDAINRLDIGGRIITLTDIYAGVNKHKYYPFHDNP